MQQLKTTIDTNILIYLFDTSSGETEVIQSCNLLKAILDTSKQIKIDIKISTSFEDDIANDKDELRKSSVLLRVRNIFQQISLGQTILENGEYLPARMEDRADFQELKRILFPGLTAKNPHYSNCINDLRHIASHIKNKRDIYITNDKNFINKRDVLKKSFNTQIMSSVEFVAFVYSFKDIDSYEYKSAPKRLDYVNLALSGKGELDFTNNNGIYTIGNGDLIFEVQWGGCNNEKMRIYNHPSTIESIALAEDKNIKEITNDRYYDFTDHCREIRRKKDVIILKNSKGYYAAVKIIDFEVKDRGGKRNFLNFEYAISPSGECNFKNFKKPTRT